VFYSTKVFDQASKVTQVFIEQLMAFIQQGTRVNGKLG
jgi:hypothetical protein